MTNSNTDLNALEMSDEEFMKNPSQFDTVNQDIPDDDLSTEDTETNQDTEDLETSEEESPAVLPENEPEKVEAPAVESPAKEPSEDLLDNTGELTTEQYAEVGRRVMAEFKANGTMMKVKSAEDALQLMQMGANYHKKMVGLKPSLKTLKLLENNGLLDPEKLNYLIDLSQKKPEAIKQLLKDSELDPLSLDLDDQTETYVPSNRTVNDKELLLDEILNNISESPSYERTLNVISRQWDDTSRKAIADDPELIAVINSHMDKGIFDQVANAVAYERSLGKLMGVSELEAYQRVGSYMHENNLFNTATKAPPVTPATATPSTPAQANAQQQEEKQRQERKRAASPSRQGTAPSTKDTDYNPLAMSDEEFAKLHKLSI